MKNFLLLDAICDGEYFYKDLFRDKEDYEGFFNKKWHGLSASCLKKEIENFIREGYVIRVEDTINSTEEWSSLYLSESGGLLWEGLFSVNWLKYYDYEFVEKKFSNYAELKLIVNSPSEEIARDALKWLTDAYFSDVACGEIKKGISIWRWSPWKVFEEYFTGSSILQCAHDFFPYYDPVFMQNAEDLRKGWKAEWPVEIPK